MSDTGRSRRRGGRHPFTAPTALVVTGLAMLGVGVWSGSAPSPPSPPPLGPEVADVRAAPVPEPGWLAPLFTAAAGAVPTSPADRPAGPGEGASGPVLTRPVGLAIPSLGLRAPLVELGLDAHGRLEVPADAQQAGWWRGGPAPGEEGAAVLVGHVDSHLGPGVFWRLAELAPGDRVVVDGADGTSRVFVVDGVGRWPKNAFPTDAVYRQAEGPELRLITCGGAFDERTRSYRDNIVVFATAE